MNHIPIELRKAIKNGECVLFVGAGLSEGLPNWEELVRPLADELGISMDKDLRIIASYYENEFGRPRLEEKVISQLKRDVPITKTHNLLASLPLKAIVTTNYDHLLERALSKKKIARIIHDREAPLAGADQLPLIKMHGDFDDPSSMIITKKDYDEYPKNHRALITYLLGLLISCNFLFVGFGLEDPNFDNIYVQIRSLFGNSKRKSYAIFKNPSLFEIKRLKKDMGIEVIPIKEYGEIPKIFRRLYNICKKKPRIKAKSTPQELESIQNMFCEVVERQNKWLDPRGIFQFGNLLARKEVELESVYVVPRLVRHVAIQKSKEKEKEEEKVLEIHKNSKDLEREELEEHIFETQIELAVKDAISRVENRHMVILGEPGIGKTCLLRYIALKVSASAKASEIKSLFPVLVPLREYIEFGQDEMLREFIFHHIR
jgi:hypothetical protein